MLRRGVRTIFKRNTRIFQRNLWKSMLEQPVRQIHGMRYVVDTFFKLADDQTATDLEQKKQNSNRHKSISESLIKEVPVIEVDGTVAMCDGGTYHNLFPFKNSTRSETPLNRQANRGGATGHPVEYIQLNTTDRSKPQTCKYCGLRFVQKAH